MLASPKKHFEFRQMNKLPTCYAASCKTIEFNYQLTAIWIVDFLLKYFLNFTKIINILNRRMKFRNQKKVRKERDHVSEINLSFFSL